MSDATTTRRNPLPWLVLVVLTAAIVTPVVIDVTRPVVHGWAETVGFIAGVIAACVAIREVLRRLGTPARG